MFSPLLSSFFLLPSSPSWAFTSIRISSQPLAEHVHSVGRILGDRSVLYKYLNPNLVAAAVEHLDVANQKSELRYLWTHITSRHYCCPSVCVSLTESICVVVVRVCFFNPWCCNDFDKNRVWFFEQVGCLIFSKHCHCCFIENSDRVQIFLKSLKFQKEMRRLKLLLSSRLIQKIAKFFAKLIVRSCEWQYKRQCWPSDW